MKNNRGRILMKYTESAPCFVLLFLWKTRNMKVFERKELALEQVWESC
jgi:hypothetical protein